ncbi:hypothetical protein I4U23_028647 [Adineta vaga]|nr:hypothetical protein I4U23_028647 [Adineta vaga]
MAQVRQPPPPQIPTLPDVVRFQSSPSRPVPGQYGPPGNAPGQYTGSSARPLGPQQNASYPSPQIGNRPPPPPQMMNRPPPPPPSSQMVGQPSSQMMNRPPPPPPQSSQIAGQPSAQMIQRPPPPPSQMTGHPSAQMGQRMPTPQVGNYPPSQFPTRRPSQAPPPGNVFPSSNNARYDPLTSAISVPSSNHNSNFEHSQVISRASNRLPSGDQQLPPSVSNTASPFQQRPLNELPFSKFNERDASSGIRTVSDDDALSMVSMNKKHLPVYARFPFDVTFLSQPMNMTVDNSIQDLRHRLIESELDHQRRTTDEYIKRTHRIGMETDPETKMDLERELEIQKIQASLNSGRRSRAPVLLSDYSYEPRTQLQPLNEILDGPTFASSNMDDLIDSMARRHLADRQYNMSANQRHSGRAGYSPYFESSPLGRRVTLRSQQRPNDIYFTNTTPTSFLEHDINRTSPHILNDTLRSGNNAPNHPQRDFDNLDTNNMMRSDSVTRLPPISVGMDTNHFNRSQFPANSSLFLAKHNFPGYKNYQQTVPLSLPDHSEHLIELPSDIFLTARRDQLYTPIPRLKIQKSKPHKSRRRRQSSSEDSETEPSNDDDDDDNDNDDDNVDDGLFADNHRRHRSRHRQEEQGFFTERNPQQRSNKKSKHRKQLFRKAIIAVLFIKVLKQRASRSRSKSSRQSLSATIHKIRLQEIMVALHRVYLEPEGPIYNALIQAIVNPVELKNALNPSSKSYSQAIYVIADALKNIISRIVDFMPKDGVLGTSKTSAIAALIQPGNPFPENYFWQCERELLDFNKTRLVNITKQRAIILIIGSFIFRGLVTTLLTKPIKYRLLLGQLTPNQAASLKVLASVIFYVGRRAVKSHPQILSLPQEWSLSLYNDAAIKPIVQHSEIKPIIAMCEQSLRTWAEQYIRRIDQSFGKELRA